jgi:lipopolysaccharide export system protein LptC
MVFRNRNSQRLRYLVMLVVALGMAVALLSLPQVLDRKPAAVVPVPQTAPRWTTRHEHALARIHQGEVELLLIGDSITQAVGR